MMEFEQRAAESVVIANLMSDNAALRRQVAELTTACEAVLTWWGRVYPPDIFDGSSGNENALAIVRIRNMVCAALGQEEE